MYKRIIVQISLARMVAKCHLGFDGFDSFIIKALRKINTKWKVRKDENCVKLWFYSFVAT